MAGTLHGLSAVIRRRGEMPLQQADPAGENIPRTTVCSVLITGRWAKSWTTWKGRCFVGLQKGVGSTSKGHLLQAIRASFQSQWGINGISETRISLQSAASGRVDEWKNWQAGELLFIMAGTSLPCALKDSSRAEDSAYQMLNLCYFMFSGCFC